MSAPREREAIRTDLAKALIEPPPECDCELCVGAWSRRCRLLADVGPLLEQLDERQRSLDAEISAGASKAADDAAEYTRDVTALCDERDALQGKVAWQAVEIAALKAQLVRWLPVDPPPLPSYMTTISNSSEPFVFELPGDSERCPNCRKLLDCCGNCSCGVQTGGQQQ